MILTSNGGPQPSSRHVTEHGIRLLETFKSVDYKGRQILKSYHVGVSSHLLPAFFTNKG